jgi:hypothetical protein
MRIKNVFPKMVLVLGVVSILLASMPTGVAAEDCLSYVGGQNNGDCGLFGGGPLGRAESGFDYQAWEDAGWTVTANENTDTGDVNITRTHPADDTTNGDRWETKVHYNGKTGEYEEERIVIHPDGSTESSTHEGTISGDMFPRTHKTSETHMTPDGRKSTTAYRPDGSQSSVVAWDGTGRKYADNEYDANGNMTSSESWDADGTHYKNTFDANGNMIASEKTGPDGTKTVTTYGPTGSSYSVTTDPEGHVTKVTKADGYGDRYTATFSGDCVMDPRIGHFGQIIKGSGCHRTSLTSFEPKTGKEEVIRYDQDGNVISDTGGKDQIKADVLGQIEGKPSGDLAGGQVKLPAGMTQQPVNGNVNFQPMPRGALPGGKSGISSVIPGGQSTGPATPDLGAKKIPGTVTTLPLQITPKTDSNLKVDLKGKLNVTPGSKSVGKIWKGGGVSKVNVQSQAVQQNKFKANYKRWRSSAGASGPIVK